MEAGQIIILNGVPRSGKSSIARVIVETFPGDWVNLGVDFWMREKTPKEFLPGIGLRPGGERPDLEPFVRQSYAELHEQIAATARQGMNVVADIGYHAWYAQPFDPFSDAQERFKGLPMLFVGVKCPIETIMARRNATDSGYAQSSPDNPIPEPVRRWQDAVHQDRAYDLEVDTSVMSPEECARGILELSK